ncbi:MAG: RuvA C-terminal domain-containing protein [Ruthenibacterium lactatiformans]|nr:RuvA C-terminal domain-containing protein [Ruthenibacterium lactatiformans]
MAQAIAALTGLGYTGSEAAQAIARLDPSLPVQELIRLALQGIGKGR